MVNHGNGPTVVLRGVCECVCVRERERQRDCQWAALQGMLKGPLALPDQGVLLAHIRALPLVIYVYLMSKHTRT